MNKFLLGGLAIGAGLLLMNAYQKPLKSMEKFVTILGHNTYIYVPTNASDSDILVYLHGINNDITKRGPNLAKSLNDGPLLRKILVAPQLGQHAEPGNLSTDFDKWLNQVCNEIGLTNRPLINLISHSGGYNATADIINQVSIFSITLLDSLYGRYNDFYNYIKTKRHFLDIYGPGTSNLSLQLQKATSSYKNAIFQATSIFHDSIPEAFFSGQIKI